MFLSEDERSSCLRRLRKLIEAVSSSESRDYFMEMISQLITLVESNQDLATADRGDNYFHLTFGSIKQKLLIEIDIEALKDIHFEIASFLRNLSYGGYHNFNEHSIVRFYLDQKFTQIEYKKIDSIRFDVPLKFVLAPHEDGLKKIIEIHSKVEGWETGLKIWEDRVEDSERRYEGVLGNNNYLGLASAFMALLNEKNKELRRTFSALIIVGLIAVLIPFLYVANGNSKNITSLISGAQEIDTIAIFVFSIALEILILYYFRIIYSQWTLLKHQLLQLNLRHQMCAFASDYARSSQDMDKSTLTKFENLVFSELSSENSVPPSIYDAVDAISKVIGSIRKG